MLAVGCGVSAGLVSAVPIALGAGPDSTRAALVAMWLLKTVGFNVGFGSIPLLILHFPSGVPQRGLRRRLATVSAVLVALSTLAWLIRERDHFADGTPFPNPLVPSVVGDLPDGATMPLAVGLVVATLVAIGTIAYRYRRSAGIERLQLRWFAAATASLPVLLFAGNIAASHLDTFGTVLFYAGWALGVNGIAVAIGIAVTRYHLYEIDRIISRTVTYGMVTAVLFVVYIVTVTIPGAIFGLTSDLLVAAATLASAVVFVPVRRRIQDLVDRRFNRSHYDAARVLDAFSARLRDSLDFGHLTEDLRATVTATVQPTAVTIWIPRPTEETAVHRQLHGAARPRPS